MPGSQCSALSLKIAEATVAIDNVAKSTLYSAPTKARILEELRANLAQLVAEFEKECVPKPRG
jgi:hypothetical protein